jgi:lycopene beta-cyclase
MYGITIYRIWLVYRAFRLQAFKETVVDTLWDIVIVGGGLGGLSLAAELAAPRFAGLSVLVLEKRSHYVRDRTWSYWTDKPHKYSHLERHHWSQWSASLGAAVHTQSSARTSYATLDADAFYQAAVQAIAQAPHINLRMNCSVATLSTTGIGETVITMEQGDAVRARRVFDARPKLQNHPSALVQQFTGWEVQTERDVFQSDRVTLMAFEPHPRGLHFWYVLPYSARCALVESTWVSPSSWQPDYDSELQAYLANLCDDAPYTVGYREYGVLGLQPVQHGPEHTVGLGRLGGTLRPATGYAFIDTIDHAAQLAQSLSVAIASGTPAAWQPEAFQRSEVEQWMDSVFLDVLASDWLHAPEYFMRMFGLLGADDVVAFLTGRASWAQRLGVMRSLPVAPFARTALSRVLSGGAA